MEANCFGKDDSIPALLRGGVSDSWYGGDLIGIPYKGFISGRQRYQVLLRVNGVYKTVACLSRIPKDADDLNLQIKKGAKRNIRECAKRIKQETATKDSMERLLEKMDDGVSWVSTQPGPSCTFEHEKPQGECPISRPGETDV